MENKGYKNFNMYGGKKDLKNDYYKSKYLKYKMKYLDLKKNL